MRWAGAPTRDSSCAAPRGGVVSAALAAPSLQCPLAVTLHRLRCAMRRIACLLLGFVLLNASAAGARAPGSGISGRIVAGPTCPVESVPPAPGCAPRPLRATLRIRRLGTHGFPTSLRTAANGRFRVRLSPGTYVVRALPHTGAALPRPPAPSRVTVQTAHYTFITITYDTGIR